MKTLFISIVSILSFFTCGKTDNRTAEGMQSFCYSHHGMINFTYSYYVVRKGDKAKVIIHEGTSEEHKMTTDTTVFTVLQSFVDKYKMNKYKKSYSPAFEILDGDSWNLYITYSDKTQTISSGGNNAGPKGSGAAFNEIVEYLEGLFEKK